MKKRAYVLPVAVLIISLVAAVFLTVWFSPFIFHVVSDGLYSTDTLSRPDSSPEKVTQRLEKLCKFADKMYETSPNESTLYAMTALYNPESYWVSLNYGMPEGYFEKCVKYTKMDMEITEETQNANWQEGYFDLNKISMTVRPWDFEKVQFLSKIRYALALYLNGQNAESVKEIDACIDYYKQCRNQESPISFAFFSRYFDMVYATALERGENTDWIIERELDITEFEKANNPKLSDYYRNMDNLYPNLNFEQIKEKYYNAISKVQVIEP